MDKDIRERIHYRRVATARVLSGDTVQDIHCNCGHDWPCPILRVYEDAENLKAGLLDPATHIWNWDEGSGGYVYEYCSVCGGQRTDVGDRPCTGPKEPENRIEVFTAEPGLYIFGQEHPRG